MNWLLNSNTTGARFARTVIEAVLAFIAANIVVILSGFNMDATASAAVCAIVTAVISPVLAALKKADGEEE